MIHEPQTSGSKANSPKVEAVALGGIPIHNTAHALDLHVPTEN